MRIIYDDLCKDILRWSWNLGEIFSRVTAQLGNDFEWAANELLKVKGLWD